MAGHGTLLDADADHGTLGPFAALSAGPTLGRRFVGESHRWQHLVVTANYVTEGRRASHRCSGRNAGAGTAERVDRIGEIRVGGRCRRRCQVDVSRLISGRQLHVEASGLRAIQCG